MCMPTAHTPTSRWPKVTGDLQQLQGLPPPSHLKLAGYPVGALHAAGVPAEELTEARLSEFMAMSYAPDPDLFIRTGGEVRISNFLLWQAAYTEFVFSDCLWPEFGERELDAAIAAFHERDRRFGGVKETPIAA